MFSVGTMFVVVFKYLVEFWVANEGEYRFGTLSMNCTEDQSCFLGDHSFKVEDGGWRMMKNETKGS